MSDVESAKALFETGKYTCVLCKGETVYTSDLSGISPMVTYLNNGIDLKGFSAADKIVGKAAALLFVLAEVTEVYASILSRSAEEVFIKYGVKYSYDILTDNIVNRKGTGLCPMEETVKDIEEPQAAFSGIKHTLEILKTRSTEDKR